MIIGQGAEAIVRKEGDTVVKERFAKTYRHPTLDKQLRQFRTRREAKVLDKLSSLGFLSPQLKESCDKDMTISMEHIDGSVLKDVFNVEKHCAAIGKKIAFLHSNNIIHGDLTTSNMIMTDDIHFIDFGLSFFSEKIEDKAVDLHLLDRALESKHHTSYPESMEQVFDAYKETYPDASSVLERYEVVKNRGRNKKKINF